MKLSINDTQLSITQCPYAECLLVVCRIFLFHCWMSLYLMPLCRMSWRLFSPFRRKPRLEWKDRSRSEIKKSKIIFILEKGFFAGAERIFLRFFRKKWKGFFLRFFLRLRFWLTRWEKETAPLWCRSFKKNIFWPSHLRFRQIS